MEETWKDIPGYEGYYQVSDNGQVKSLTRVVTYKTGAIRTYPSKILKPKITHKGYLAVTLSRNSKCQYAEIHRLVAMVFLPDFSAELHVHHLDDDPRRNVPSNLQLLSHASHCRIHTIERVSLGLHRTRRMIADRV